MCINHILGYECGHGIEQDEVDRCLMAEHQQQETCGNVSDSVHNIPDDCPDCIADRNMDDDLERAIQSSAREYGKKADEYGFVDDDDEEEDVLRKIMDMTLQDAIREQEKREAEQVELLLKQSRVEFMNTIGRMGVHEGEGNWEQRAKGYDPDNDDEDIYDHPSFVRATETHVPMPAASVPQWRPEASSSSSSRAPVASSSRTQPSNVGSSSSRANAAASSSRSQGTAPPSVRDDNASQAARNRWAQKTFPKPEPKPQPEPKFPPLSSFNPRNKNNGKALMPPTAPLPVAGPSNTRSARPQTNPAAPRPVPSSSSGINIKPIAEVKKEQAELIKRKAAEAASQAGRPLPSVHSGSIEPRNTSRPAQARPTNPVLDIPNWGTGTPQIPRPPGANPAPPPQAVESAEEEDDDESGDEDVDEDTPPPSPRTMRAMRLKALGR